LRISLALDILNPQRLNCPETTATEIHGPKTGRSAIEEEKKGEGQEEEEEEKKKKKKEEEEEKKKKNLCLTV
jgi:hypothetical protein